MSSPVVANTQFLIVLSSIRVAIRLEQNSADINKNYSINHGAYVCMLQILAIWVQVPPGNAYFDEPEAGGRQNHVHQQGPVLWNHAGVHP